MARDRETTCSLGQARLEPVDDVVAGSYGTWRLIYTAGKAGLAAGGALGVAWIWPSDWGEPQFSDRSGANYTTARAGNGARLALTYSRDGYIEPYQKLLLVRALEALPAGTEVVITFGDTSGGGPGCQAQTFTETCHQFLVLVDHDGSGTLVRLSPSPAVRVVGGRAVSLSVVAPSEVIAGQPFAVLIRAEDAWSNPAPAYCGEADLLAVPSDGPGRDLGSVTLHAGFARADSLVIAEPGVWQIAASTPEGMRALSNPIVCRPLPPLYRLLWGDIHGQCEIGCGAGGLTEYFRYARDVSGLDVAANQPNCFLVSREDWAETLRVCREMNEPGRFVTLLGYEWSGESDVGGDHNIYLPGDEGDIRRASHRLVPDKSDEHTDLPTIEDVFAHYEGSGALIVAHVGGRPADLTYHSPDLQRLVEIQSGHGRFEWFAREALARGYRVGFIAGSDGVMGRSGNDHPGLFYGRNVRGGLVGIYAGEHSRAGILAALRARRCYGTSGKRIVLWVEADGQPMGAEYRAVAPPTVKAWAVGTAPLEGIDLYRGPDLILTAPDHGLGPRDFRQLLVAWSGAACKGTGKANRVVWDGELTLSEGRIVKAEGYGFDSPMDAIVGCDERGVAWRSVTAGDADGLILTVDAPPHAVLSFRTEPAQFDLPLRDLNAGEVVFPAGLLDCRVLVVPRSLLDRPRWLSFSYTDTGAQRGVNAYWVRVRQVDDERAWSSPIFVELT